MPEVQEQEYNIAPSPSMEMLSTNRNESFEYRRPRQLKWNEIYPIYRDTVRINRLTQRQSVNLPLMKTVIRTVLSNSDDLPVIEFKNLDHEDDDEKEIFLNEYWKRTLDENNAESQDFIDKKQEYLFGRTYDSWQIVGGKVKWTIVPVEDILISRYANPASIHSARYLIHTNIFLPLSDFEGNKDYDQEAIDELKMWYGTRNGLIKLSENQENLTMKNQKLRDLGIPNLDDPTLSETTIEIAIHFVKEKRKNDKDEQIYVYVEADGRRIIRECPLEDIMGVTEDDYWKTHFPYNSWADDPDAVHWHTDGFGDMLLTPNKVLNVWFSQQVENRTLKNLNMHVFDATIEGYSPQTFTPRAFGFYPVPGKPKDVYQQMQIGDLGDTYKDMEFLIGMLEKASGASATQQGAPSERQITLGEVKLALSQAQERVKTLSKFYTKVWKQRAEMFLKVIEGGSDKLDAVKIFKQGRNSDKIFSREISPKDWQSKQGYIAKVWSQEEKNSQDEQKLQKLVFVRKEMPSNIKLKSINNRMILEYAGLKPDDISAIMDEEEKRDELIAQIMAQGGQPGMPNQQQSLPPGQAAPPVNGTPPVA